MSPFHRIDVLHDGRVVRVVRSERQYDTAFELKQERLRLSAALDGLGRDGRSLLIDSRVAPHSTDEKMHEEFRRFRTDVARGFERVAALVRSKVGILQVNRLVGDAIASVQAFDDEAQAMAYLLGQRTPSSRPR